MKGIDTLSEISGLSTDVIKEIAAKVIENNKKLNSCSLHNFDTPCDTRNWKCKNCGGTVDTRIKRWYENGLDHGKGV